MAISRELYKCIEFELNHYEQYKRELKTCGSQTLINVPQYLKHMENSVAAIEQALKTLNENYRNLFKAIYIGHGKTVVSVCMDLFIHERMYYIWKNKLIYAVGIELGVIALHEKELR